ncbi:hypothetical protein B0G69_7468 [Paraburkholderia sp. RAU2J]|uniref:hypothetical protein n=1 Tax=Paraburkholderia sp. RAU2J TaxID=1938810 RepID=UPI000EAFFAC6|nr:hypothetical protein [Paraburkholderia sp. RAU2J]RKT14236.1 hypothetical protein B0G69_7468 [Paraburkholderia sp. RAU2J]
MTASSMSMYAMPPELQIASDDPLRESKKLMNTLLRQRASHVLDATPATQRAATLSDEHHQLALAFLKKRRLG